MGGSFSHQADEKSAAMSFLYAKHSVLTDHLHNATAVGSPPELYYYSSPAGRLELKRRMLQSPRGEYAEIQQRLDDSEPPKAPAVDDEVFTQWASEGEHIVRSGSLSFSENVPWETKQKIAAFLAVESHEWLRRTSTEEQEAISFLTSNGFYLLQDSVNEELSGEARRVATPFLHETLTSIEQNSDASYDEMEDKANAAIKAFTRKYRSRVTAALAKAQKLSEPLTAYRGTSMAALESELGETAIKDKLISGELLGKRFGRKSSYATIPRSASLVPTRALSFCTDEESVVLELKQKTLASPVMVSAWGGSEAEVYTNPASTYKITGYREEKAAGGWDILVVVVEEED